jgi:vacuolar-type H+-ATPase subunit H
MPEITADDIAKIVKDALYITVGAGVLGFQKAQVGRRELTDAVNKQINEAKERFDGVNGSNDLLEQARAQVQKLVEGAEDQVKVVEDRLTAVEERYEALLDQIETKLPEQARDLFKQSRDAAKDARTQVRTLVNRTAA